MLQRIKIRRDLKNSWVLNNPVLAEGELGFEKDTYKLKIGNGLSTWIDLPYFIGFNTLNIEDWPSTVTTTDIGQLEGITSNIQNQLDSKADDDHTHDIGVLLGAGAVTNQVAVWDGIKWGPKSLNSVLTGWTKQEFFFGDPIILSGIPVGPVLWFKNGLLTMLDEELDLVSGDVATAVFQAV